jgi:integrase
VMFCALLEGTGLDQEEYLQEMQMGVKIREKPPNSGIWWIFINHQGKRRAKKVGRDGKLALEVLRRRWGTLPDWVFCNEHGGSLSYPNFIHRVWNRALEKSDLRRRTPHDMRHTYATLRLSKGDSLAEVSKEMGHASTDITYRTYSKWLPKESRSNIDELDDIDASTCNLSATKN